MYSPRVQHEPVVDPTKYDPQANQWMREALDSRQTIDELKTQSDKLQRDLYAMNSKVNLIYECLGDLNMVDRVGDLMQKKIRDFQLAQYARQSAPPAAAFMNSPRQRKLSEAGKLDDGVICGSAAFHQTAAYSSSYEGQVARDTFNRKNMFDTEEALYREKYDIFGNAKLPSPKGGPQPTAARRGDAIDSLLTGAGSDPTIASGPFSPTRQQPAPLAASARSYGPR